MDRAVGTGGPTEAGSPVEPPPRPSTPAALRAVLAAAVFAVVAVLAYQVSVEVRSRRSDGFCRTDHGIVGATGYEVRTWWPIGERCYLRTADGVTRVRHPGWALTGTLAVAGAAVAAGALAPAGSARRRLALALAVPALPVAAVVFFTVHPRSPARLTALTSISLAFGALLVPVTAAVVWFVLRGRVLLTVLGSWLVWSVVIFLQGRPAT